VLKIEIWYLSCEFHSHTEVSESLHQNRSDYDNYGWHVLAILCVLASKHYTIGDCEVM
jgi:hypothetical protein